MERALPGDRKVSSHGRALGRRRIALSARRMAKPGLPRSEHPARQRLQPWDRDSGRDLQLSLKKKKVFWGLHLAPRTRPATAQAGAAACVRVSG